MVRRNEENAGPEAMRAATGHDHVEWREILAAAGAMDWSHQQTASWLREEHGLDGWWAQGVTVDFEQARKGRLPGMQSDGTFSTSTSRTLPGARLDALALAVVAVTARHGEPHGQNLAASQPVVRWRLEDGTRLAAAAGPEKPTGTAITLTRERLTSHDQIPAAKDELRALLDDAGSDDAGS